MTIRRVPPCHIGTAMTFTFVARTMTLLLGGAGASFIAAADTFDRMGTTTVGLLSGIYLTFAALLLLRLRHVAVVITEDEVVLRGPLGSTAIARDAVDAIHTSDWRSEVVLRDGRSVPTLLRTIDLTALDLADASQPVADAATEQPEVLAAA